MHRVLLLSKYSRMGASSRLRTHQYIPNLKKEDIEITVSSLYDDEYLRGFYTTKSRNIFKVLSCYIKRVKQLLNTYNYDLLLIEKEALPYIPYFIERILLNKRKYIVDYDDAVFHNYDNNNRLLVRLILGSKIGKVMRNANAVIVGNDYLKDYAEKHSAKNIVYIPTVIDEKRYSKHSKPKSKMLTVGWIGSPFTQKYLSLIKDDLVETYKKNKFKLLLVGATLEMIEEFEGLNVEVIQWEESSEVALIQKMDIGIMPLPDEPFEHGKCGYKLIQYMGCGVPVVASDVGVNRSVIEFNECGYVVNENDSFSDSLLALISDETLRERYSINALASIRERYNLERQSFVLSKTIKQV